MISKSNDTEPIWEWIFFWLRLIIHAEAHIRPEKKIEIIHARRNLNFESYTVDGFNKLSLFHAFSKNLNTKFVRNEKYKVWATRFFSFSSRRILLTGPISLILFIYSNCKNLMRVTETLYKHLKVMWMIKSSEVNQIKWENFALMQVSHGRSASNAYEHA